MRRFIKSSKIDKELIKQWYEAGKEAYEVGHPMDPNEMIDDNNLPLSEELSDAYWRGFEDAQEEANQEQEDQ